MKKTNKILEAKPEIIIIVIVLILIVLAFIQPIHVFIPSCICSNLESLMNSFIIFTGIPVAS